MTIPLHHRGTEKVTTEKDRLDDLTETRLAQFGSTSFDVGYARSRLDDRREAEASVMRFEARADLRSRIRDLEDEAYEAGKAGEERRER